MNQLTKKLALISGLLSLTACAMAPLSYLEAKPHSALLSSTQYPVRVVSIDGSLQFSMPVQIAAGERHLVLEAMPSMSANKTKQKSVLLKIAPCTRYFLLAQRGSPMQADWDLVVASSEVVSACDPAEELLKAKNDQ